MAHEVLEKLLMGVLSRADLETLGETSRGGAPEEAHGVARSSWPPEGRSPELGSLGRNRATSRF